MFVASLCSVPLTGCQDGGATVRFRVIAKVLHKGSKYEASTVMECRYARIKNSLVGMGGSTTLYGEALIFDLPAGLGTFYLLPRWRGADGGLNQVYEQGVLSTLGIKSSVGGLKDSDLELLSNARGRKAFDFFGHMPTIVVFQDETNPKSIIEIGRGEFATIFPGAEFVGLDIEITTDPVTDQLTQRLPWLDAREQVFDRDPPGRQRPDRDIPIGFMITKSHFFGNGSR
ncbi:MAG: hypothetical protein O9309_11735 [Rhizobium sp.]|nr:hypothetical protein [Rhizobium sp.]